MIFVNRGVVVPPASLIEKDGAGQLEYEKAKKFFSSKNAKANKTSKTKSKKPDSKKPKFKFKAYKGEDVVATLENLFHRKCAYCESQIRATASIDVEHYRPKGAVEGEDSHPGYWWLAADWTNLLPSCIDCNRRRKHRSATSGMALEQLTISKKQLSGKLDAFPIRGTKRAACPADRLDTEDPLLIDPTRHKPEKHLGWGFVADLSVAIPSIHDNQEDPYGAASIRILGLNRQGLVEERTDLLLRIKYEYLRLMERINFATGLKEKELKSFLPLLQTDFNTFLAYADADRPYSACALAYINTAKVELIQYLQALKK